MEEVELGLGRSGVETFAYVAQMQYLASVSLIKAPSLSASMPSTGMGICSPIRLSPSTTRDCSRAMRATASVHPELTSVATRLCRYSPAIDPPPCTTKSISRCPGSGSTQSANVLIGISRPTRFRATFLLRLPAHFRTGFSKRSIVAALAALRRRHTSSSRCRCPCFSIAVTRVGMTPFCSGAFLKAEGRRIFPPFSDQTEPGGYQDETEVFDDALGLPRKIQIFTQDRNLLCAYKVLESTNVAGLTIPLRFVIEEYPSGSREGSELSLQASGAVTSLRRTARPEVPREVMIHADRRNLLRNQIMVPKVRY